MPKQSIIKSPTPYRSHVGRIVIAVVGLFAVMTSVKAQLPVLTRDMQLQVATGATVSLIAPSETAGYSLTLPSTRGSAGALLTADGSGLLYWSTPNGTMWTLTGNSGTSAATNFLGTTDGQPLTIRTNNTERLRITSAGLVLIGSTSGSNTLDITGSFGVTGNSTLGTTGASVTIGSLSTTLKTSVGANDRIVLASSSGVLDQASISSVVAAGIAGNAWALTGNSTSDAWNGTTGTRLGTTSAQPLVIATTNSTAQDIRFFTGSSGGNERMRITGTDGLVGIGTPSPSMVLDVAGTFRASGTATLSSGALVTGTTTINSTGVAATTIGATGSTVTIGSIATTLKTSVGSNDRIVIANSSGTLDQASIASVVAAGVAGNAWAVTGNGTTDSTLNYIGTTDETVARPLVIRTDGTERARFAGGSGYAGFATASPNVQVDVNGGLATRPGTATANSATTSVTVGNRSFVVITSDEVFNSRKVTLTDGLQDGQRLVILVLGSGNNATYGVRLETGDANLSLSGDAGLEHGDTIELIYHSGVWRELRRSANDE